MRRQPERATTQRIVKMQPKLFDADPSWRDEWVGMPEFTQQRQREYAKLVIRFRSQADLDDFAAKIGQKLNANSQCTWHPELLPGELGNSGKVYVDES